VSAVALIAGEYDLIVEIPYPWEQACRVIVDHLLPLPGVSTTRTLVAIPHLDTVEDDRDQFSAWS
jgi:DNA-binding Lrp family transcriptional regulator